MGNTLATMKAKVNKRGVSKIVATTVETQQQKRPRSPHKQKKRNAIVACATGLGVVGPRQRKACRPTDRVHDVIKHIK